ncbi:MAG: myxococcus cysteine-rich repeat containing protein [Myxococcota bacterium]|nr:myxococcus cysteine-rich repeat containing protein [Myxococcota bacterium]
MLVLLLVDAPSLAHDTKLAVEGTFVDSSRSLQFEGAGQAIQLVHDPALDGFSFLLVGRGTTSSRSELVRLDPSLWSFTPGAGYRYTDESGSAGGVTQASYNAGSLQILTSRSWPWQPSGVLDELQVHVQAGDQWYCAEFDVAALGFDVLVNDGFRFRAQNAPAPATCPDVCGNGDVEEGEECDDGNLEDGDGCTNDCRVGDCFGDDYASTFEAIQGIIFDGVYSCTNLLCHNPANTLDVSQLDLTAPNAYTELLGADLQGAPSTLSTKRRVVPTEPEASFLYEKLAAATFFPDAVLQGGTPMPSGAVPPLTPLHLEAVYEWIRGGAPEDRVVAGTSALLGSCLPEADPLIVPTPEPPAEGQGIQLQQTARALPAQSESEVCMITYYDATDFVPEEARIPCPARYAFEEGVRGIQNPDSQCFAYKRTTLIQDPQSHHEIVLAYAGFSDTDAPAWGAWTKKFRDAAHPEHGQSCDPKALTPGLPYNDGCSSEATVSTACVGYGPSDFGELSATTLFGGGGLTPQVMIAQEPYSDFEFAAGAYDYLPLKGVIAWNSHAFNLTNGDSTMSSFLNFEFKKSQQLYPVEKTFHFESIFAMAVPPFESREYCRTFTYPVNSHVFRLSSHMHQRGVLFRMWEPPNDPCTAGCDPGANLACAFLDVAPLPECEGPREDPPFYYSPNYTDPLELTFAPPVFLESLDPADRSYLYCAQYDNGSTIDSPPVKLQSTSPVSDGGLPPNIAGGPCPNSTVACLNEGMTQGMLCDGLDAACDNAGQVDGVCDACPVIGGVTTDDEMFAIFTDYFIAPEPSVGLMASVALTVLGALARRGRLRG